MGFEYLTPKSFVKMAPAPVWITSINFELAVFSLCPLFKFEFKPESE